MTARTTRTLNPLHFEDLEPHRFEDLVRQLAYQFRSWRVIEATGRLGADEGMDIRAIESRGAEMEPTGEEEEDAPAPARADRIWVFQCKRERKIGPTAARQIVKDAIPTGADPPYGFVLAAACDFSLKTRNAVREESQARGVSEIHLWGKAELEDQLFLPVNDHLLFAYFNISLQVRRRSLKTELRSRLATKRALVRIFGEIENPAPHMVLLRDPREERYPRAEAIPDFAAFPRWLCATVIGHQPPDHLLLMLRRHFAYVDDAGEHWDAMFGFADESGGISRSVPRFDDQRERTEQRWRYHTYWTNHVPDANRGFLDVMACIHYDRILAIDEHGDCIHGDPHLLVEFDSDRGAFDGHLHRSIEFGPALNRRHLRD